MCVCKRRIDERAICKNKVGIGMHWQNIFTMIPTHFLRTSHGQWINLKGVVNPPVGFLTPQFDLRFGEVENMKILRKRIVLLKVMIFRDSFN